MASAGNAAHQATTSDELKALEKGDINWSNVTVVMKVLKKTLSGEKVGKRGPFRILNLTLCNDNEDRLRLVAFSPGAEKLNDLVEENALVLFTGLAVQEPYNSTDVIGSYKLEFRAFGTSEATVLVSDYSVSRGMPLTLIRNLDIPLDKPSKRYKVTAELTTNFTPFLKGLTGQAVICDSSGRMPVHVNIDRAPPGSEIRFRPGKTVSLKGTFRKMSSVVRVVVESDGDVEFLDNSRPPFFGNAATSKLLPKEPVVSWYPGHPPSVAKVCQGASQFTAYPPASSGKTASKAPKSNGHLPITPSASGTSCVSHSDTNHVELDQISTISGVIETDFEVRDEICWGVVLVGGDDYYEVNIHNLPNGAEMVLTKGVAINLRGVTFGFGITVEGWRDVSVAGHELFVFEEEEEAVIVPTAAADLRQLVEPAMHMVKGRMLNARQMGSDTVLTCLVIDDTKVIVKISVKQCTQSVLNIKPGCDIVARGMVAFNGSFCEMLLEDPDAVQLASSGSAVGISEQAAVKPEFAGRAIVGPKQEPREDLSRFGNATRSTGGIPNPRGKGKTGGKGAAGGNNNTGRMPVQQKGLSALSENAILKNVTNVVTEVVTIHDDGSSIVTPIKDKKNARKKPPNASSSATISKGEKADTKKNESASVAPSDNVVPPIVRKRKGPSLNVGIAAGQRPKRESKKIMPDDWHNLVHVPNPFPDVPEATHNFGDDALDGINSGDNNNDSGIVNDGEEADQLQQVNDFSNGSAAADEDPDA